MKPVLAATALLALWTPAYAECWESISEPSQRIHINPPHPTLPIQPTQFFMVGHGEAAECRQVEGTSYNCVFTGSTHEFETELAIVIEESGVLLTVFDNIAPANAHRRCQY